MYVGVSSYGLIDIQSDDAFNEFTKKMCKKGYISGQDVYVLGSIVYFYFRGNAFGYGGDEDIIKTKQYGKNKSTRICQIRNTRVEHEEYGPVGSVHVTYIGSMRFTYKKLYPEIKDSYACIIDTIDGNKIAYDKDGKIVKIGSKALV